MSILLPVAQQFVIVGLKLIQKLQANELFVKYFENKQHQLKTLNDIDDINLDEYPNLSQTLFIIEHFDFDPNAPARGKDGDVQLKADMSIDGDTISQKSTHNHNNNHLLNPHLAKSMPNEEAGDEDASELESVGYTTDYDDIDDETINDSIHTESGSIKDYDGGKCFSTLISLHCSVMGSMALIQNIRLLESKDAPISMVPQERPLHNLAMRNTLITFSGIASKSDAQQLLTLTRYMGAKSREDVTRKTTHLVAGNLKGFKYRRALELGISIMNPSWVGESYRLAQNDTTFEASQPEIVLRYKLKPFHGLYIAFIGFKEDDYKELCDLTVTNEGTIVDAECSPCTHIVVDAISGFDDSNNRLLSGINPNSDSYVVYREWFWASLEIEGKISEDTYAVPGFKPHTRQFSRSRRESTGYNQSFSNVMSPMLDYSRSPESMSCIPDRRSSRMHGIVESPESIDLTKITARHRACLELLQTERNYVKVLKTIVTLFKVPLDNPDASDPILPMTDVKILFGNLTPIYEVHKKMLSNLEQIIEADWKETNCIGKVFVSHSIELLKAYPPFVNFFEDTKKTIDVCDAKYPRFHAFLKRCQSKIECNRESLTEMLIRPVQRLPSISLIITELIKRTDDSNPDKKYLIEALESIRRVMNLINEDKRKTEGQIAMFDIVNNIEGCPPNLLSALRKFVCKAEARLLFMNNESEVIPSKSHKVVLFLFSDLIEICKIRSLKRSHSSKGQRMYAVPIRRTLNSNQANKFHSNKKEHRHLDELHLCDIMNIYKKCQSPEMTDALVIQARPSQKYDQNFRYYPFIIDDEHITKDTFVERLEECLLNCDDPEHVSDYVPNNDHPISNDTIDFGYANQLVHTMEKSRLSRVLSIRQALLSPSVKAQRNLNLYSQG